jgi:light-harvesting complex I chlorophyll a/b binding protein 1
MADAEGKAAKVAVARSIAELEDLSDNVGHLLEQPSEAEAEAAIRSALQKVNAARTLVPQMVAKAGGKRGVVAKKPVAKRPAAKRPAAKRPPARKPAARRTASRVVRKLGNTPIKEGDIGVLPPLGVFDPLNLMTKMPDKYRRWQEMEIKHGRFAMAAVTHVLVTTAGFRWPGYLSYAEDIKFADMPGGTLASWEALPGLAWAQIVLVVALLDNSVLAQDPKEAPGDLFAGGPWVRYPDVPGTGGREFKLNAERSNGRLAMMGIIGMIVNEALTGNPIYPIDIPPQPVLSLTYADGENAPALVGSFILASLGMAFVGGLGAFNQFGKDGDLDETFQRGR